MASRFIPPASSASSPKHNDTGFFGKKKTGTKNTKTAFPKTETPPSGLLNEEKKPRKPKIKMNRVPSVNQDMENDSIPDWIKKSSMKKPTRQEGTESKLQWRRETKKSQRSFSKNKEREYLLKKESSEVSSENPRKPFRNTFDKKYSSESNDKKGPASFQERKKDVVSTPRPVVIRERYIAPKPTWEKDNTPINKKELIDPSK